MLYLFYLIYSYINQYYIILDNILYIIVKYSFYLFRYKIRNNCEITY